MFHCQNRTRCVIMDYKTLFTDINVANELLYAEDEDKGLFRVLALCAINHIPLQHLFVIWNG